MGDFNGNNYKDKFVGDLVDFVASDKFQTMFEGFFLAHALEFSYDEEHKLKYYELYQKFHAMFENQLELFCDQIGITQFMKRCREVITEDAKAKRYIEILMASVEYTTFVQLMRMMRPVAETRQALAMKAESKDDAKPVEASPSKSAKDSGDDSTKSESKSSGNVADAKATYSDSKGSK